MPIDRATLDPMLNPFREMLADVETRGLSGPDVEAMREQLALMERLGQEMGDIGAYVGQLSQEQAFNKFSDAYGRALAAGAQRGADGGGGAGAQPSDEQLLQNTLRAYGDTLAMYERGDGGEEVKLLIPVLQRMLEIGASGVSYPVFLRMLEEQGLARALDGAAPAARAALERSLGFAQQSWLPRAVEQETEVLRLFDELAAAAPFGQPDPIQFNLASSQIEWDYAPLHARWSAEVDRWSYLLELLVDWVDAHASFAPYDARWRPPGASEADVARNIARTRQCTPGELRYREGLYREYFNSDWDGIWRAETFTWEYTARRIEWSDARLQLIRDTYPHCTPGGAPPGSLVARAEQLHPDGDYRPDRLQHPPWGTPLVSFPI